jgi:hypothetical protein
VARAMVMAAIVFAASFQEKPMKAPELDGGLGWINTDKPVTMASLKGKVVLLDFWTYC